MKPSEWCLGILMCFGAVGGWAAPPENALQQEVTVVVLNAGVDPAKPVQKVRVSLGYIDGATLITVTGATRYDATNSEGKAMLLVALEAVQRGALRINIEGASDLVIYEPADGQLTGLPSTVTIKLLPKGSPALLGPAQINALLHRLSLQNKQLTQENRAVKGELAAAQSKKPDELTAAMTEWAKANGFAIADVDKQVRQWAEEIQQGKKQATDEQKALAELALKHYGIAAQLFNQAANDIGQSMDEDEKRFLEERRSKLRNLVDKSYQSSKAFQLDLKYHQATQILEQARDRAAAEHKRYPEDAALRAIWLDALDRTAGARDQEGEIASASDSSLLLTQSIKDYQVLLREYSLLAEREDLARTQHNLGNALSDQGERSSGAQATELLAQAVEAYRAALEVFTKAKTPQDWAAIQNDLGAALLKQGERSSGSQSTDLLAQAVQAFRAALELQTKADLPQDWAMTQNNLGVALTDQGERSSGAQATELLAQAVEAYRAELDVQPKADLPLDWAKTQHNLGTTLMRQGERSSGAQATELLVQAIAAYRAALEVFTKAELPQGWARTQNALGAALKDQSKWSSGAQATKFLAQAVEAYRAALEVYTKAELPQDWAMTESNMGAALKDQGERSRGAQATELLAQSVTAFRAALEVFNKAELPQGWATTQDNLGGALLYQGVQSSGAQATELLAQAVAAYRAALEVYTKAEQPQDWAATQNNLGLALANQGEQSSGAQATELLAQSVAAYRAALEVRTKAELPQDWADTQFNLGLVLTYQGDFSGAANAFEASMEVNPADVDVLSRAVTIYHDKLYRYDRAYELTERWLKIDSSNAARADFMEASLTAAHFAGCIEQAATIEDSALSAPGIILRDTMKLACQWGAGEKAAAQETEKALLPKVAGLQKTDWELAGTIHFLTISPTFENGRASWIALFDSLEKGDGAAMAGALKQLDEVIKH